METSNIMENQILNTKYNVLVLTDFSDASNIALKYAISLAKLIKGNIHIYHFANPGKIIESDNQVAVLRDVELETKKVERKIGAIIEIITAEGVNVIPHYSMGNIIYEFEDQIDLINPDLVIIGKKKENLMLSGKITSYLMNEYKGSLLIIGEESEFQIDTKICLGCSNNTLNQYDPSILYLLDKQITAPLTLLNIKKPNDSSELINIPQIWRESCNEVGRNIKVEHENDSSIADGLLKHISNNKISLLCIGKGKPKNFMQRLISGRSSTISEIVDKVHIPILVLGTNSN